MAEEAADVKPNDVLTIVLRDQANGDMHFKIKHSTKFEKVFKAYADRKGVDISACRFFLDGQRVKENDTPKEMGLNDMDSLDVMFQQTGGSGAC